MTTEYKDIKRVEASAASIEATLITNQAGFETTNKAWAYKDSGGTMHYFSKSISISSDSGAGSVNLYSGTVTVAGGTNINTSYSGSTLTVNLNTNIVMADGATIGQATGPLITFDDTSNQLEITGCNVGIGTATPSHTLTVANSSGSAEIGIDPDGSSDGNLRFLDNGTQRWRLSFVNSDNTFRIVDDNADSSMLTFTNESRIGIGTDNPNAYMQITGSHSSNTGIRINPDITSLGGATTLSIIQSTGTLTTEDDTITYTTIANTWVGAATISKGASDTVNRGASLFVAGPATGASINYSFLVDSGVSSFGGNVYIGTNSLGHGDGSGALSFDSSENATFTDNVALRNDKYLTLGNNGVSDSSIRFNNTNSTLEINNAINSIIEGIVLSTASDCSSIEMKLNSVSYFIAADNQVSITQPIIVPDGGSIGNAGSEPKITFDSTNNYLEITNATVGIGVTVPEATLHVFSGDSTFAPNANGDDGFFENNFECGITVGSGDAYDASIYLGHPSNVTHGYFQSNYSANQVELGSADASSVLVLQGGNAVEGCRIDNNGDVTFAQDIIMNDGKFIGFNSGGPKITFDTTGDYLEITDCKVVVNGTVGDAILTVGGSLSDSDVTGVQLIQTLTASGGNTAAHMRISNGSITTQDATVTYNYVTSLFLQDPVISKGATDTITIGATLYINNAPTEATDNYGIYVASGDIGVNGDIIIKDDHFAYFGDSKALDGSITWDSTNDILTIKNARTTALASLVLETDDDSTSIEFKVAGTTRGWFYADQFFLYDPFRFEDGGIIVGNSQVTFRDANIGIYSQADSYLDIFADGAVRIGDSQAGAPTNYVEIEGDGDVNFVGGAGLQYAEISVVENNTANTFSGSGEANKTQFLQFDTNGASNGSATPDHTNDHITVGKTGDYLITCSITAESSGAGSREISFDIYKNNGATAITNLHSHRELAGLGGDTGSISISGITSLTANDTIELWVHNETGSESVILHDVTLSAIQIGG